MISGKRAPVAAGIAMAVVAILAFLFVVNPKRSEVSDARAQLEEVKAQELSLQTQLASLRQAEADAPANRKIIERVESQLPPTADPQGLILLLSHAANQAGVDFFAGAPGTPALNGSTGVTVIPITLTLVGTYFSLDEFMFQVETLPRAAKATSITLAPSSDAGATTSTGNLTMQVVMELYTTDQSAGPGSEPGPSEDTTAPAPVEPIPSPTG